MYTPTVKYILQGSSLNNKELCEVSNSTKHLFLQKMRYSKTMARDIVAGSPELGGLGMMDLYIEQGLLNLQILFKAMADCQIAGDITRITIRKWKWHLGTGKDPFQEHKNGYSHNESQWLHSVRAFSVQYNITIHSGNNEFPLQRVNDRYIMEWAEEMGFSQFELRFLIHCQLYLNVMSISDITNESGSSLDPSIMKFKMLPERKADGQVNQSKPDHTKWSIWFKFLANITRQRQKHLKQPLEEWIIDYSQIRRKYASYRTPKKVFKHSQGEIYSRHITSIAGTEWTGMSQEVVQVIPEEAVPCLLSYTGLIYTSYKKADLSAKESVLQELSPQQLNNIGGKNITGDPIKFMRQSIQVDIMEKYYRKKLGDSYDHIQWNILKKALKKKRAKGALLKMLHGVSPTQQYLTKIRLTSHPECPCCHHPEEDVFHILSCKERDQMAVEDFISTVKKLFKGIQNQGNILTQIFDSARSKTIHMDSKWSLEQQSEIGWGLLLKGLVTKD